MYGTIIGKKLSCTSCRQIFTLSFIQNVKPIILGETTQLEQDLLANLYCHHSNTNPETGHWFHEIGLCLSCLQQEYFDADALTAAERTAALTYVLNDAELSAQKILENIETDFIDTTFDWKNSLFAQNTIKEYQDGIQPHLETIVSWFGRNFSDMPILWYEPSVNWEIKSGIEGCDAIFELEEPVQNICFYRQQLMSRAEVDAVLADKGMGLLEKNVRLQVKALTDIREQDLPEEHL